MPVCLANRKIIVTLKWTAYGDDKFFDYLLLLHGVRELFCDFVCENISSNYYCRTKDEVKVSKQEFHWQNDCEKRIEIYIVIWNYLGNFPVLHSSRVCRFWGEEPRHSSTDFPLIAIFSTTCELLTWFPLISCFVRNHLRTTVLISIKLHWRNYLIIFFAF